MTVTDLPAGAQVVTVETSWDNGATWVAVRGGGPLDATAGVFVRDYFPALNRPIVYRVRVEGDMPVQSDPITVESDFWWLQDPLAPKEAARLVTREFPEEEGVSLLLMGALADANLNQSSESLSIIGARLPVVSVGTRQAASEVPFHMAYEIAAEGGALKRLIESAGQLVLRGAQDSILDPVAHVAFPSVKLAYTTPGKGQVASFDGVLIQARPINMRVVVPFWSYAEVSALGWGSMTYADVAAARPGATYLDWQRDPEEGA